MRVSSFGLLLGPLLLRVCFCRALLRVVHLTAGDRWEAANKHHEELAALRYTNNAAGPQTFFEDMDKLAQRLNDLALFQTSVTDKMTYLQSAF